MRFALTALGIFSNACCLTVTWLQVLATKVSILPAKRF
jgi:hypothetical protein